jgi:hypothetical protein
LGKNRFPPELKQELVFSKKNSKKKVPEKKKAQKLFVFEHEHFWFCPQKSITYQTPPRSKKKSE